MVYNLFQYYKDELTGWNSTLETYNQQSGEFVRKISVGTKQQIKAGPDKESETFIDRFMAQEQNFGQITNLITSQQQRLDRSVTIPVKPIEDSICDQQDLLRTRMHAAEKNFVRIKYACSVFMSSFLNGNV